MPETAAFRGWKAQDAIEWFHGVDRRVCSPAALARRDRCLHPVYLGKVGNEFTMHASINVVQLLQTGAGRLWNSRNLEDSFSGYQLSLDQNEIAEAGRKFSMHTTGVSSTIAIFRVGCPSNRGKGDLDRTMRLSPRGTVGRLLKHNGKSKLPLFQRML